jgi:hypothetical protein
MFLFNTFFFDNTYYRDGAHSAVCKSLLMILSITVTQFTQYQVAYLKQ